MVRKEKSGSGIKTRDIFWVWSGAAKTNTNTKKPPFSFRSGDERCHEHRTPMNQTIVSGRNIKRNSVKSETDTTRRYTRYLKWVRLNQKKKKKKDDEYKAEEPNQVEHYPTTS